MKKNLKFNLVEKPLNIHFKKIHYFIMELGSYCTYNFLSQFMYCMIYFEESTNSTNSQRLYLDCTFSFLFSNTQLRKQTRIWALALRAPDCKVHSPYLEIKMQGRPNSVSMLDLFLWLVLCCFCFTHTHTHTHIYIYINVCI